VGVTLLGMRGEAHLSSNLRYLAAAPLSEADMRTLRSERSLKSAQL